MGFTLIKYGLLKPCENIERQIHKIENKLGTTNNQILSETFDMITSVKLFSTESHHLKDFQMNSERSLKNLKFIVFLRCFREFTNGILQVCIFGGVLYYGLTVMNSNSSGVGDLPAFFLLIRSFRELFGRIKWHHETLVREFADIERYVGDFFSSKKHCGLAILNKKKDAKILPFFRLSLGPIIYYFFDGRFPSFSRYLNRTFP